LKLLTPQHFSNAYKGGTVTLGPGLWYTPTPIIINGAKGWNLRAHGARVLGALEFAACQNFTSEGLTLDGGRDGEPTSRTCTLRVTACDDFRIERFDFVNAQLDHLYISDGTRDGVFTDCEFDNAWRNAISVTNGRLLTFERPVIRNVHGTRPKAGIDIEPNADDPAPTDIAIMSPQISNVGGFGILAPKLSNAPHRISVEGGTVEGGIVLHGDDHEIESVRVKGFTAIRGSNPRVVDCDVDGQIWVAGPGNIVDRNRSPLPIKIEDVE
jgi:hypothetical protein